MGILDRIGRYRIERELGRGGMGIVYAGYDEQLERPVAIKTLAEAGADDKQRKRLLREARAAARIHHPNVCHLYEVAEEDDKPFIVMELLEGESLATRLTRGPLAVSEAVQVGQEVLSALEALHADSVVHRDLKPSNIFLTPHGIKLLDFGLARAIRTEVAPSTAPTESQLTQAGAIVGTPPYMAPEQFQGAPPDARTDLFALGAVLFEMLTANRAFPGDTPMEIYHKTMYEQPPALGGSEAVAVLDRVIRRVLSKRPEDRYQSASAMAEALSKAEGLEDTGEAPRAHAMTRLLVLPFRMLRPDEHTEFLAFSVPDAVTNALAGLESLVVRSSAVASRFGDHNPDLKKIAEEADVDVVLRGTLLRAGEQLRVTVQLLEVPDGTVLWSHAPQVTMRDVFQLQDQIVEHIVESLSLSLTAREHKRLKGDVPVSPTAYEFFLRGNELVAPQGLGSASNLRVARDLYSRAVEEDPRYAPAWARLGRCDWLIGKGGEDKEENVRRAEECFEKALELNPELPLAHNLYALLEIDQGRAQDAMTRLVRRALAGSAQPELYASLVQACRFCGLLEASVAAHGRACELDRNVTTSVYHTHWQLGDDERSLQTIKHPVYLDALILGMRGNEREAIRLLRDREQRKLPEIMRSLLASLRALLEGHREECVQETEKIIAAFPDPEFVALVSRHLAYFAENEQVLVVLGKVLDRGFVCYRMLIREDPWLDPLRSAPGFKELLERAQVRYQEAVAAYVEAGGERLLGVSLPT